MLPENLYKIYSQFYDSVFKSSGFDSKMTSLLFIAPFTTVACYP